MKKTNLYVIVCLFLCLVLANISNVYGQRQGRRITTNKNQVITLAVQGRIAPATPATSYVTTWDGKSKMAIGTGGINYNLNLGANIFGWANGDRATMGVATVGVGEDRNKAAWLEYTAIGNQVKVLSGFAQGDKGVVIGKFGSFILLHFENSTLDKLAINDILHVKAYGVGLKIQGQDDVFIHGVAPEILEAIVRQRRDSLVVPVVKTIPAELVGQGHGRGSLSGNWHIQTCYPPDIKEFGLDELRFGDLVLLQDIQTDYGMGYFKGGATLGVVCSGPSDISGLGIGVTPILSTRTANISPQIDPTANIAKYLDIAMPAYDTPTSTTAYQLNGPMIVESSTITRPAAFTTNKNQLITTAVEGVIQPAGSRGYRTTYDGTPKLGIGMASINYTVSMGDPAYGWASTDHVEPDVTIQGRDQSSPSQCALAILACIGNQARVVSGEAKGARGLFVGRHAGFADLVWFPKDVLDKLTLNDRIMVKARGVGLKIEGFPDVRVNKLDPDLLENLGITIDGDQISVPIVLEVPGHIMGSGIGGSFLETGDYDIQTTDPKIVEQYDLKKLKLGDIVAIRDHLDVFGRGRYPGALTIGVIIHGWSDYAGHGPGVNPILSALPGKIKTTTNPDANIAYYLNIKPNPKK